MTVLRWLLLVIGFANTLWVASATAEAADDIWPGAVFSEVRAYAWPESLQSITVIFPGIKLVDGMINEEGALLNAGQVNQLLGAVRAPRFKRIHFSCYVPRNAFVFYDDAGIAVAYLEICFECHGHRLSPDREDKEVDLMVLASIFDELKLPMGMYKDLAAFQAHLRKLKEESEE